jgi:hypothetical protein
LPPALSALADSNIQSISFELCGSDFPELVKYNFAMALIPLYCTTYSGAIKPYTEPVTIPRAVGDEFWEKVQNLEASTSFDFGEDKLKVP